MGIQYVGGVTSGRAGSISTTTQSLTSLTGGIGTAPAAGDLVIVSVAIGSAGRTPSALISGYTTLAQVDSNGTGFDTSLGVSYSFMGGTPDTSVTIPATGNAADAQRWTVRVYRGVDPTTPLDVTAVSAAGTGTSRANPPAITPVTPGAWIMCVGAGSDGTASAFTFGDLTDVIGGATADTNDAVIASGDKIDWVSGAFDCAASTSGSTNSAASWAAYSIALRPYVLPVYDGPIQYVGRVTGNRDGQFSGDTSQSLTSLTGGIGTAPIEGDLVVVSLAVGEVANPPAYDIGGYELLGPLEFTGSSKFVSLSVFRKFMGTTPDTTVSIPPSGSATAGQAWVVDVYRGVHTGTPLDVTPTSDGGGTAIPDPPAITPVTAGAWVHIAAAAGADVATAFTFTGLTDYAQDAGLDSAAARIATGYYDAWTSGAYDVAASSTGNSGVANAWASYALALRPGPSPEGGPVDLATETDAALAHGAVLLRLAGQAGETDAALALSAVFGRPVGLATHANTALAVDRRLVRATGICSEAEAALSRSATLVRSAGAATETDAAIARTATVADSVGTATESDSALSRGAALGIGHSSETDAALACTAVGRRAPGQAAESDTALALDASSAQIAATGTAVETDVAQACARVLLHGAGQAAETGTALALGARQIRSTGVATETGTAFARAAVLARTAGTAAETDAARTLGIAHGAGATAESDTSLALARVLRAATGTVSEVDEAIDRPLGASAVGTASEADLAIARGAVLIRAAAAATESGTALALGVTVARSVGMATSAQAALPLDPVLARAAGAASSSEAALSRGAVLLRAAGAGSEADTALALAARVVRGAGLATQGNTALAIAALLAKGTGLAVGTDGAMQLGIGLPLGLAVEVDEAFEIRPPGGEVGLAADVEAALALEIVVTLRHLASRGRPKSVPDRADTQHEQRAPALQAATRSSQQPAPRHNTQNAKR